MTIKKIAEKINREYPILDLVQNANISLTKRGKNYFGLCPFHDEKTPSFSVSTEKNIAFCMSCKKGGAPINFYMQLNRLDFQTAVNNLSKDLGIETNFKVNKNQVLYDILEDSMQFYKIVLNETKHGKNAMDYLKDRNIDKESIEFFNIGYTPQGDDILYKTLNQKGYTDSDISLSGVCRDIVVDEKVKYLDFFKNDRIMFPITNMNNQVLGFSGRVIDSSSSNSKYTNSYNNIIFEKSKIIYNLYNSLLNNDKKEVYLFEGYFDVIKSHQAGVKNSIATMGTSLTQDHLDIIYKNFKTITLCYDGDNAGYLATLDNLKLFDISKININIILFPEKLDPDEYIEKYGSKNYQDFLLNNKKSYYEFYYSLYEKDLDKNNSNSVNDFISKIENIFYKANNVIKKIYEQKISTLLNIDNFKFKYQSYTQIDNIPEIKKVNKKLESENKKYKNAEKQLFKIAICNFKNYTYIEEKYPTINLYYTTHFADLKIYYNEYIYPPKTLEDYKAIKASSTSFINSLYNNEHEYNMLAIDLEFQKIYSYNLIDTFIDLLKIRDIHKKIEKIEEEKLYETNMQTRSIQQMEINKLVSKICEMKNYHYNSLKPGISKDDDKN